MIVFEDLNAKAMQQFNGQMVNDNVIGMITELVKYKAELNSNVYHEIGRFVKSSGICHECHHVHKLELNVRNFTCESCGKAQCRDLAAANGIISWGAAQISLEIAF